MTAAAGMAMGGLKPVVAVYSTFFARAFDQANLDVGLLGLPVVTVLDRAGITGDDGPSHHGILDMALALAIPGMTIFAPSTAEEIPGMLQTALSLTGPATIRFPKTAPVAVDGNIGSGMQARCLQRGTGELCVMAVGKMVATAYRALALLGDDARRITLYDVRVVPLDDDMIKDAVNHQRVVTIEDGVRHGGVGALILGAVRTAAQVAHQPAPVGRALGVPRAYLEHAKPDQLLGDLGLDAEGLADTFRRALADEPEVERVLPLADRPVYW
jgi:1-deoxy-D-xylulose-5-phosphate synthase